jgi:hypothetical protein
LTYNERPATIAVTVNEKGQLVNAFVGGALATVVFPRVLLLEKSSGHPSDNRRQELTDSGAAVNTLGENLGDMKCAASAVAKTILEALGFRW